MRHVFSNSQCAHVFAQQSQDRGRGSSVSFTGDTFLSYSTPIARVVKSRRGGLKVLLESSAKYSVSTARHSSLVWRAWNGSAFAVPSLGTTGGRHWEQYPTNKVDHRRNLSHLIAEVRAEAGRIRRAQKYTNTKCLYTRERNAERYARLFGFKTPTWDSLHEELRLHLEKKAARANTPAAIKRREQGAAERERRKERQRIAQAERDKASREANAETLAKWKTGEYTGWLPWGASRDERGSAFLRVKPGDPTIVETSIGAEVPIADAERVYRRQSIKVGFFQVSKIHADGGMTIGCHYISNEEIERFAVSQGWRKA